MPKVLIVDDEPFIRLLLEQTLEELEDDGVELLSTDNGETALDIIRAEIPEMVFLDVMMPKMNGFDVCTVVKNDPRLSQVFVVLLTAKGQEFDKQKGIDVGADIYMTKPFNPDEVLAKTREILGISR
jgi:DNA-binding response OmpR family regulator